MTVMPGMIDAHRHDVINNEGKVRPSVLEGLLARGVTTVMIPGGVVPEVFELSQDLSESRIHGPRLVAAGTSFTAPNDWPVPLFREDSLGRERALFEVDDPTIARGYVSELATAGTDAIKVYYDAVIVPQVQLADRVFEAIADEAHRNNLPVYVHALRVDDVAPAVSLGADRLVHTPFVGLFEGRPEADLLRNAGIAVATTVTIDVLNIDALDDPTQLSAAESRLDQRLRNIRHLWDAGVTVAFGTDSPAALGPTVMTEIMALSGTLTPAEIIASLTRNAAEFLYLGDELGTLERDKIADIVMIDGDPLEDIADLDDVAIVIQGGRIVVDNRED
jgi:imidazolonepropionase-like amidohydrolase